MVTFTENGMEYSYDLNAMLRSDAEWLAKQAKRRKVRNFIKTAEMLSLRQEDWDIFWKEFRIERMLRTQRMQTNKSI